MSVSILPGIPAPVRSSEFVVLRRNRMQHAVRLRHLTTVLVAAAAVAASIAGCGSSDSSQSAQGAAKPSASQQPTSSGSSQSPPSAGPAAVTIDNFKFVPASLTVTQETITVTNRDATAHTTTADDGKSFDTGNIDPGSSATISQSKPGPTSITATSTRSCTGPRREVKLELTCCPRSRPAEVIGRMSHDSTAEPIKRPNGPHSRAART
jgi:plastocyanin